ncbi:hypothetical protein NHP190002_12340 [Helicobacter ailurogastricus]|nr:hypothetical protein NHP190002_12340 [Helicobacter ailurogastricus]
MRSPIFKVVLTAKNPKKTRRPLELSIMFKISWTGDIFFGSNTERKVMDGVAIKTRKRAA